MFKVLGLSRDLFSSAICPALLKVLSESVDVAGIHKYFNAHCARVLKLWNNNCCDWNLLVMCRNLSIVPRGTALICFTCIKL